MIAATLSFIAVLAGVQGAPVKLQRAFTKGQKLNYEVKSTMNIESREFGLDTWMPEDLDIQYKYSLEVVQNKPDGIVDLKYLRPTMTEIQGETADSPPKSRVEKVNMDLLLTLSPMNEILKIQDLAKKPDPKKPDPKKPGGGGLKALVSPGLAPTGAQLGGVLGQFVNEIYRLSLFLGPLDSSMDFAPRLPFDDVAPGDTWKRTVGYTPQKLKGTKDGKLAVQRLDYTYTYKGIVDSNGKKVHRVTAALDVKTDLAEFIHQTYDVKSDETGLKEIPLEFKGEILFDLDLKTMQTLRAVGTSQGGFKLSVNQVKDRPVIEQKLKGRTVLRLLNP